MLSVVNFAEMFWTRAELRAELTGAALKARVAGQLNWNGDVPAFVVTRPPLGRTGRGSSRERVDFATNLALVLAPVCNLKPDDVAAQLLPYLSWPGRQFVAQGFLNFVMDDQQLLSTVARALEEERHYGAGAALKGTRINVEFVSAEPTRPLSLTGGRHAAVGEALCRVLELQGADVTREFYLNDVASSTKMRVMGESVAAHYLEAFGREVEWPEDALRDDFVRGVARRVIETEGNVYLLLPEEERIAAFTHQARESAVESQKKTLANFGVRFDVWTSEDVLRREGRVAVAIERLKERGHAYEKSRATWLRTTAFGDSADRPLVRANGDYTYLAADVAYHALKFARGFDVLIDLWTAQHAPYVARTRAALEATGYNPNQLQVLLCQGARLLHDGAPLHIGRGGGTYTLDEALESIDSDTLRFLLVERNVEERLDIEKETATHDDESNPAYAARLAPSRLATLIRELEAAPAASAEDGFTPEERELARLVALWPDEALTAAQGRAPQRVASFVSEFANAVRALLTASRPGESYGRRNERLQLLKAAQITVSNALRVLGIEATERF